MRRDLDNASDRLNEVGVITLTFQLNGIINLAGSRLVGVLFLSSMRHPFGKVHSQHGSTEPPGFFPDNKDKSGSALKTDTHCYNPAPRRSPPAPASTSYLHHVKMSVSTLSPRRYTVFLVLHSPAMFGFGAPFTLQI